MKIKKIKGLFANCWPLPDTGLPGHRGQGGAGGVEAGPGDDLAHLQVAEVTNN